MTLSDQQREDLKSLCIGVFIVAVFAGVLFGGWAFAGTATGADGGYGSVINRVNYKCDSSTSGCTVIYVQTPNSVINATFTCTYYNNVTSFHLRHDIGGWFIWFHYNNYYLDTGPSGLMRGC